MNSETLSSIPKPLQEACNQPPGARFRLCALQVNPAKYAEQFRGQTPKSGEEDYIEDLLRRAKTQAIEVIAVTNHNDVGAIDAFRAAAVPFGITIFPGFELHSSDGVHVLCLYEPDITTDKLDRYLGDFGIHDPGPSNRLSSDSFCTILAKTCKQGGITVAAHVSGAKGLLTVLKGQTCMNAWRDENLFAVQIPEAVAGLPLNIRQIVTNKNSDYQRDPRGRNLALAVVNAKDVDAPEVIEDPRASCFIKMSEVSIEGLRQAFLDPDSRIRLYDDLPETDHAEIACIAWEGGFLDGVRLRLNSNLNVLVGGRGTGKSTIIESIRYVLGISPKVESARKNHDSIVRGAIQQTTKISLLLRVRKPSEVTYVVERTVPNPPIVKTVHGEIVSISPADLVPDIEIFGQHEIAEIARDDHRQTTLLERFRAVDPEFAGREVELRRSLEKVRRRILDATTDKENLEERLSRLPRIEETLKAYKSAGLEDKLKEQTSMIREERLLEAVAERLDPLREGYETLQRELPIDLTFVSSRVLEDLPSRETLKEIEPALKDLSGRLEELNRKAFSEIRSTESALAGVRAKWSLRKESVDKEYEKILRTLQKSDIDAGEFLSLRRQIEDLKPLRQQMKSIDNELESLGKQRRQFMAEWEDLLRRKFQDLQNAAKKVSRELAPRVDVQVVPGGSRAPLEDLLREHIGGQLAGAINAFNSREEFSPIQLADDCRQGKDALIQKYGTPSGTAERICNGSKEFMMLLEELELPTTTLIRLNVAPDDQSPEWKTLNDLSTGQKATAILLLLLLQSDAPLIVDQPEDDLDNRFITEGIVPKMRDEKLRRQFIFATHNANIPVLGDAELIVGLEARESQAFIRSDLRGSIDTAKVQHLVEETLEGGREAFEMRRLKYGF